MNTYYRILSLIFFALGIAENFFAYNVDVAREFAIIGWISLATSSVLKKLEDK